MGTVALPFPTGPGNIHEFGHLCYLHPFMAIRASYACGGSCTSPRDGLINGVGGGGDLVHPPTQANTSTHPKKTNQTKKNSSREK